MTSAASSSTQTTHAHCALPSCGKTEGKGITLKTCSGCHTVSYCGQIDQKADWKRHKKECPDLAKAALKTVNVMQLQVDAKYADTLTENCLKAKDVKEHRKHVFEVFREKGQGLLEIISPLLQHYPIDAQGNTITDGGQLEAIHALAMEQVSRIMSHEESNALINALTEELFEDHESPETTALIKKSDELIEKRIKLTNQVNKQNT